MTTSRIILLTLTCATAAGCGGNIKAPSTSPVTGTVFKGGKPAVGVTVTFHPKFDMGSVKFIPSGLTDQNGRFTLTTAEPGDGAPRGDYSVTFELIMGGYDARGLDVEVDAWKGKYADLAEGRWLVTVKRGDNEVGLFELD